MANNLAEKFNLDMYLPEEKKSRKSKTKSKVKIVVLPKSIKRLVAFMLVVAALSTCLLYLRAEQEKLNYKITKIEESLEVAEAENVRLNTEYTRIFEAFEIDENCLLKKYGITKAELSQICYIDLSEGDKIIVSGDKTKCDSWWEEVTYYHHLHNA